MELFIQMVSRLQKHFKFFHILNITILQLIKNSIKLQNFREYLKHFSVGSKNSEAYSDYRKNYRLVKRNFSNLHNFNKENTILKRILEKILDLCL